MGVSLGRYIIVGGNFNATTIKHEQGHQKQSLIFGWLYLLIIGLPSFTRNIYGRIFLLNKKNFDFKKWYYGGFPEAQADEFGGVKRF